MRLDQLVNHHGKKFAKVAEITEVKETENRRNKIKTKQNAAEI